MVFDLNIATNELIILIVYIILFLIQIYYYLHFYSKPYKKAKYVESEQINFTKNLVPVSIVIYSKNDSENLRKHLSSVLDQDYPEFEVIIVNDNSTYEVNNVIGEYQQKYKNIYQTFIPEKAHHLSRKKLSLTLGIKAAKYDWILFTQPNCSPISNQWIRTMARNFTPKTSIVIGYTTIKKKKYLRDRYRSLDNMFESLRFLSYALLNKAYTGYGSNLAYRKQLFFDHKGFSKFLKLKIGDDSLFINTAATKSNVRVELYPKSLVVAEYEHKHKAWIEHKYITAFTTKYLKTGAKYVFGFETFTRYLFYGTMISLCVIGSHNPLLFGTAAFLFLVRLILQIILLNKSAVAFKEYKPWVMILFYDFSQPVIDYAFKFKRLFTKGRKFTSLM